MCKFTNRLFVLVLMQFVALGICKPAKMRNSVSDLLDLLYNDYFDYGYQAEEVHYDQRQKGEENFKVRLDGFLIGFPSPDYSWLQSVADEYHINAMPKKFITSGTDNSVVDTTTAQVVNIPVPKKDIESRQENSDDSTNSPRTKPYLLQLLQLLGRTQR